MPSFSIILAYILNTLKNHNLQTETLFIGRSSVRTDPALAHAVPPTSPSLCSRDGPSPRPHRPRRARRSLARSLTRASCRGRAPSACPCPCQGPCRRRAPHRRPPRHSVASSSVPVLSSASMSLHSSKQHPDATLKAHVAIVYFKCF